jgi:hypothetical protein
MRRTSISCYTVCTKSVCCFVRSAKGKKESGKYRIIAILLYVYILTNILHGGRTELRNNISSCSWTTYITKPAQSINDFNFLKSLNKRNKNLSLGKHEKRTCDLASKMKHKFTKMAGLHWKVKSHAFLRLHLDQMGISIVVKSCFFMSLIQFDS